MIGSRAKRRAATCRVASRVGVYCAQSIVYCEFCPHPRRSMIYLYTTAGIPNFGDELIAAHWLRYLSPQSVIVDCSGPQRARETLGAINSNAKFVRAIGKFSSAIAKTNPRGTFWDHARAGRKCFSGPSADALKNLLSGVSRFHMVGGGYISTKWPHSGALLGVALAIRETLGISVAGTGLGMTPISEPDDLPLLRDIVAAFDLLELRDIDGFSYLQRWAPVEHVVFGIDDSFLYPVTLRSGPPAVHVSSHGDGIGVDTFLEHIGPKQPGDIFYWRCHPQRDLYMEGLLKAQFPRMQTLDHTELLACNHVAPGDFMVAHRFHPHLIAARAGAKGIYLSKSPYYDTKHGSVVALGSGFASTGDPGTNTLMGRETALHTQKKDIADRIYAG